MERTGKEKWEVGLGTEDHSIFSPAKGQNLVAANMNLIAVCYGDNKKANAAFIVKADKYFDEMVDRLKNHSQHKGHHADCRAVHYAAHDPRAICDCGLVELLNNISP